MALLAAASFAKLSCLSLRYAQFPTTYSSRISASVATSKCSPTSQNAPNPSLVFPHNLEMGGSSAIAGALFAALASTNSALAAQEVLRIAAADDNRGLGLLLTLLPAVGWVLFNILQPGLSQLERMKSAKALAIGLGIGAASAAIVTPKAEAMMQEITELAAGSDSRGLLLLIVLAPAFGWVLFNILKPGLSQLEKMKGLVGAVGLSAGAMALLAAPPAEAAVQEVATLAADSDARGLLLLVVLVPAVGWVLFNILQPALSQLDKMRTSKGIAAAVGLGTATSLLFPLDRADALQELATVADSDARGTLLLGVLIPAVGWVLFNILQPALNQLDRMRAQK